MNEIVYYNNGSLYKNTTTSTNSSNNKWSESESSEFITSYYTFEHGSPAREENNMDWFSIRENKSTNEKLVKRYYMTDHYCDLNEIDDITGYDLTGIDISTDIQNVLCVSVRQNEIEIFFDVSSYDNMKAIANYYSLQPPLPEDNNFDTHPHLWKYLRQGTGIPTLQLVRMNSVKFIDGVASIFKCYSYSPS